MGKYIYIILFLFSTPDSVAAQKNNDSLFYERIYLHTDRDIYIAGENLFYKLYLKGNPDQLSRYAYLLLRDLNNSVVIHVRSEINDLVSYGNIYLPDTLSSGFYQIVCYTNLMRNGSEENYFMKEIIVANRFDEKLNPFTDVSGGNNPDIYSSKMINDSSSNRNLAIHLDKAVFNPREKISFTVDAKNNQGNNLLNLSVSVSEFIPGIPFEPSVTDYFDHKNEVSSGTGPNPDQCKYMPEFNGTVLQGRIIPIPGSINESGVYTVLVSTIDTIANMQYSFSGSVGEFCFQLNPFYEGKDLFIRLKENVKATVDLDNKISLLKTFIPSQEYNVPGIKDYLTRSGKIVQIQRYYNKRVVIDTQKVFQSFKAIPRVFYKQYITVIPSEYLELPDFFEISREILPAFKIWKNRDKYISGFLNLQYQGDTDAEPAIFLDGIPIDDISQIISLGSNAINRIEILPVIRYYGKMSFQGILAVFSKDMVIRNIQFKTPNARYRALSSQSFTKPELFTPANISVHNPDLRQVLLWEPELIRNNNDTESIECYASDLQGKYRINIQGVSSNGDPVSGSAIFEVKSELR